MEVFKNKALFPKAFPSSIFSKKFDYKSKLVRAIDKY